MDHSRRHQNEARHSIVLGIPVQLSRYRREPLLDLHLQTQPAVNQEIDLIGRREPTLPLEEDTFCHEHRFKGVLKLLLRREPKPLRA